MAAAAGGSGSRWQAIMWWRVFRKPVRPLWEGSSGVGAAVAAASGTGAIVLGGGAGGAQCEAGTPGGGDILASTMLMTVAGIVRDQACAPTADA